MVKPIVKDIIFLGQKSTVATTEDLQVAQDLIDTLTANAEKCVGMAANMIGIKKRIIVFDDNGKYTVLFNPEIIKKTTPFNTEEACLSVDGIRKCTRYKSIKIKYQNSDFQVRYKTYKDWTAQIIQHEIDHCNGIVI